MRDVRGSTRRCAAVFGVAIRYKNPALRATTRLVVQGDKEWQSNRAAASPRC